MRRTFAELVDVNDVELGFIKAMVDLTYRNKITTLGPVKQDRYDIEFMAQGNNYYIGVRFPELWNCIKRTDVNKLLHEGSGPYYSQEIKTGLSNLPVLLKKYLQNKYNMIMIDDFVGIDLIQEINQADSLNIEPLLNVNSDKLPTSWQQSFEKNSDSNSEKKASYLATIETMSPEECFSAIELTSELFNVFDMIQKISDDTQEFDDKITEKHWENKYTGQIINSDDDYDIMRAIFEELAKLSYAEKYDDDSEEDSFEPQFVSKELWLDCKDIRKGIADKINNEIQEKAQAFLKSGSKKGKRTLDKQLQALKDSIPREINMEIRKQKADKVREYVEDAWVKKESKVERPFSFNEDILDDLDAWDNTPPDNEKIESWYSPIISAWHNQLSKDSSLDDVTNDLFYHTELFF